MKQCTLTRVRVTHFIEVNKSAYYVVLPSMSLIESLFEAIPGIEVKISEGKKTKLK